MTWASLTPWVQFFMVAAVLLVGLAIAHDLIQAWREERSWRRTSHARDCSQTSGPRPNCMTTSRR